MKNFNFKELVFKKTGYKEQIIELQMYVPGINSGAYTKALHIEVKITKKVKNWFKTKKQRIYSDITLTRKQVEELRDECNKILEL